MNTLNILYCHMDILTDIGAVREWLVSDVNCRENQHSLASPGDKPTNKLLRFQLNVSHAHLQSNYFNASMLFV